MNTTTGSSPRPIGPPSTSALGNIRERLDVIAQNLADLHGIADRACGGYNSENATAKAAPQLAPNGLLDEIEQALDSLVGLSNVAVSRLSRIA